MITLSLLQFLADNGLGQIDVDLFWQNFGIDAEGVYIANIGQAQPRGTRRVQRYELYSRSLDKVAGLLMLENIANFLNGCYGVCNLPAVPEYGLENNYSNVTILPLSTPTRVGMDENDRVIWSASGEIIY